MFGIGFWEMLFCGVIGLIVLGPEKLPNAIRSVSNGIKSAKHIADGLTKELKSELNLSETDKQLKDVAQLAKKSINDGVTPR